MGDDDIRRIYDKLDGLATGQAEIRTDQKWVITAVKETSLAIANINISGCQRGQQDRADIEALKSKGRTGTNGRKTDNMPWWQVGKDGIQFHAPALVLVAAFAVAVAGYVYVHGRTIEQNAEEISTNAVSSVEKQTQLIRATLDEVKQEIREARKNK